MLYAHYVFEYPPLCRRLVIFPLILIRLARIRPIIRSYSSVGGDRGGRWHVARVSEEVAAMEQVSTCWTTCMTARMCACAHVWCGVAGDVGGAQL